MTEEANYHNIRYDLKNLKFEINALNTLAELELFLVKFEKFIFSVPFLKAVYINSVNNYNNRDKLHNTNRKNFEQEFLRRFCPIGANLSTSILNIFYFEPCKNVKNNLNCTNIIDLYTKLSGKVLDNDSFDFIFKYAEFVNNLGCYLLAVINACDGIFRNKNNNFVKLYIKSLFNEIYTKLYYIINENINTSYYGNIMYSPTPANYINNPLNQEELQILKYRKMGYSLVEIGQKLNPPLSKSHMSQKSMQIRNKLDTARTIDEAINRFENKYYNLD